MYELVIILSILEESLSRNVFGPMKSCPLETFAHIKGLNFISRKSIFVGNMKGDRL